MKRLLVLAGLVLALALSGPPAHSQTRSALTVTTCGALPLWVVGAAGALTVDANGQACVNASVTASVTGFAPGGAYATLTATGSSASVPLPAGAVVVFQNTGTTAVSCTLGVGSSTATASKNIIQPASWMAFTVGSNTFGACIDQTGSASNVVVLSGGSGIPTGAGGGSGSGGGGAVTVADGADVAQGTTTDAACATDNGTCTIEALLKRIAQRITTLIASTLNVTVVNANANGGATPANSSPVVPANQYSAYETVAASQTGQALGATGATGDYLSHCVIYPVTTSPGVVTVFDNASAAGTNVIAFAGGATSTSNLTPIAVPVGAFSTAGAWKVTTGTNVIVTCYGKFT